MPQSNTETPEPEQSGAAQHYSRSGRSTIQDLVVEFSDAGDGITIGEYLKRVMLRLWEDHEDFSGKRPFGNSGWEYPIYIALVKAKLIEGRLDEFGDPITIDDAAGWKLIDQLIRGMEFR